MFRIKVKGTVVEKQREKNTAHKKEYDVGTEVMWSRKGKVACIKRSMTWELRSCGVIKGRLLALSKSSFCGGFLNQKVPLYRPRLNALKSELRARPR